MISRLGSRQRSCSASSTVSKESMRLMRFTHVVPLQSELDPVLRAGIVDRQENRSDLLASPIRT
jgi:hypothetical protein